MRSRNRREELITAATDLFLDKGYAETDVRDITERVGVARSLFYHYFANKQAITNAVIDRQVDSFMAYVRGWTSQLGGADMRETLVELVELSRSRLTAPFSIGGLVIREQNEALYQNFVVRSSLSLADYFVRTREENGALIRYTHTRHPRESFYVLSVGIMSLLLRDLESSDELVADLIIDTLHIDA